MSFNYSENLRNKKLVDTSRKQPEGRILIYQLYFIKIMQIGEFAPLMDQIRSTNRLVSPAYHPLQHQKAHNQFNPSSIHILCFPGTPSFMTHLIATFQLLSNSEIIRLAL